MGIIFSVYTEKSCLAACLGSDLAPTDFSDAVSSPSTQISSFFSWLSRNAIDSPSRHLSKLGGMVDRF